MIPLFKVYSNTERIIPELQEVFRSGYIGQGDKVEEFEERLRHILKTPHVITTNSATSAEQLALRLIGIQPGDEVISTPLTCTATNWPLLAAGAKIKWVDVDAMTLTVDLEDLARKLTRDTKAIVLVHWGGMVLDYEALDEVLEKHKTLFCTKPWVIEDCAHAFGATWEGQPLSARKDNHLRFYSFQAIKHLTCGDGGCLTIPYNDFRMYKRGKLLRWYGIDRECNRKDFRCEANIPEWGYKFHMNDINATIGLCNLEKVDWVIKKHRDNANFFYTELTKAHKHEIDLPDIMGSCEPSWWLFTLIVDRPNDFMAHMKEKDIMVSKVHERNDKHTCVYEFRSQLPGVDYVCNHMVCIPVGWWVTEADRNYILDSILEDW